MDDMPLAEKILWGVIAAEEVNRLIAWASRDWEKLPPWFVEAYDAGDIIVAPNALHIHTLEGDHRGDPGDWIIVGVAGELYPCKPDIFEATYEATEDPLTPRSV